MKLFWLTLLLLSGDSRSEKFEVVGAADPVIVFAGEDVILPCSVKPNISIVDMRVKWFRLDDKYSEVHLYDDHEDKNTEQIQSYRGRTQLIHQELLRGNASLRLSAAQLSDQGLYKCFIQSKSWSDDITVDLKVDGRRPVITVDGFDHSGGLRLQCESEGWYSEPDLEWLDNDEVRLSPETTEMHRQKYGFSVKHSVIVHQREGKIHCRVKLKNHMLETLISTTSKMYNSWRTLVIIISFSAVLSVIAGILIPVFIYKYTKLKYLRKHKAVNVTLDADSAHHLLIVSRDGKRVSCGDTQREVDVENNRFTYYLGVLGKEGFSSGCFYYEVQVKDQNRWYLGVTTESADRKLSSWDSLSFLYFLYPLNPHNGYWTVGRRNRHYYAHESSYVSLSLRVNLQRVGVFVDYEKGLVSFYEVMSMSHIYSYTCQTFNGKLYPFVCLGTEYNSNSTPLIICDDY